MRRSAIVAALIAIVILAAGILVKGTITQPAIGNWLAAGSMTAARSGAASALLGDGRILISGGDSGAGPVASAEVFDTTGSFVAAPPMGTVRSAHSATVLIDGRVLVAGGSTGAAATNAAEIFDPTANTWTPIAGGMIQARSHHTASLLADGRVLFAGGDNAGVATSSLEVFDPAANAFSSVGVMTSARTSFASAIFSDGRVMFIGGSNGSAPLASTEIFDPTNNSVVAGPALSAPRMAHSATTLLDGRVLVAGGTTVISNPDGSTSNTDLASVEIYDPATGNFTVSASSLAAPRRDHAAFLLPNNNSVLIVGGTSSGNEMGTAEMFLPSTGTFAVTGSPAVARQHATGSALGQDGILFLAGGSNSTGTLASAELYGFATVKTDKSDYAPGTVVTITGSGWQPGETVSLTMVESPFYDSHGPFTAVADSTGKIFNNQFSPDEHDQSIRFYLTAVGSVSGIQAQNTFTDSKPSTVTVGTQSPNPIAPGSSAIYSVAVNFNGNGSACSSPLSVETPPALPAGASPSFSPSFVTNSSPNSTLTITTTSSTPPGSTTFTVLAANGGGTCQAGTATGTGTLTVVENTTTTLTSSVNPTVFGQSTTLTATVAQVTGPTTPNAGTVTFKDGATTLGSVGVTSGVAAFPVSTLTGGSHNLTATYGGTALFAASTSNTVTQAVNKATPTVSVTNSPVTYNGSPQAATVSGSVPGTASNVKYNGSATVPTSAGTYAITADFTPTDTTDYNSLSGASAGNFVINKATLSLSVTNSPVTYNGSPQAATVSGSVAGTVSNVKYNGSATVPTNAGTYAITADFTPTDTTDYNSLSAASAGNFVINKATATLSVTNSPVTYNGSPQAATVSGSVPGTVSNVKYNGSATVPTSANTYAVTADFAPTDTTNYSNLSAAPAGNFVINKATPTISVTNSPVTYNGSPQAAAVSGSVPGTVSQVNYNSVATVPTNAATYAITANFTPTDTTNFNNLSAASAGNFVINKANPTLSVTNSPVTYNGSAQAASVSGSVAGTVSNVKYNGSVTAPTNAGTYAITADFTPTDTTDYNSLSGASAGNFVINKATPTLSVTNSPVTYNGSPQAATVSGSVAGTVSNLKYNGSATVPTGANTYAIAANFAPTDATNYSALSGASAGNFVITQATPTVTVSGGPFTYDGNQHAATGAATGVGGANVSGTFAFTYTPPGNSTAPTNAGTYTVNANFTSTDPNYGNASGSGSITINKITPTFAGLTASQTIPFGQASISLGGRVNGFPMMPGKVTITINGSVVGNISLSGNPNNFGPVTFNTSTIPASATPYAITYSYSGDTNSNSASDTSTTLTVAKVTPTVTWATPAAITFNTALSATQLNATFTATVNGVSAPVAGVATYNPVAGTVLNAGAGQNLQVNFVPADTADYNNASGSVLITVNKAATSTAVTSNNNPSFSGAPVTFTATVTNGSGTSAVPTGSVQFMDGASALGSPQPVSGGHATLTTSALTVAVHSITAVYTNSDGNFNGSTSAAFSQTVKSADTTTSISAPTITFGANGLVTVTVAAVDPSAGTPTGNVTLSVDGGAAVSQALVNGSTTFTVSNPNAGSHALSASYAAQNNFNASGTTGTLVVNQAAQSINVTMHAPANAAFGASFGVAASASSGLAVAITASGSCSGSGTGSATITMTSGAGTCVVHYNQPGNTNYSAAAEVTDSTTATQLTPTVTVTDPMPTFDGTPKVASAVATGLNNAVVSGSFTFTYDGVATAPINAKTYVVVATFTSSDPNYTGATGSGFLTIKPAAATASVIDPMPTYDGTPKIPTITTNPSGLPVAVTYSLNGNPVVNPTAAGIYMVTVMITDPNYSGGGSGTLTIKPQALTVTAADASRPYGQANPTFTGTLTGVIAGDGITASYASAATGTTAAGVYGPGDPNAIIPTLSDPNNKLSNYQVTSTNGTLTVTMVPLYVVANDKTRAFGAGNPTFDAQYFGFVNGDNASSLTGTLSCTAAGASAPAGTFAVHCGGLSSPDYAIYFVDGTLAVTDPLGTIKVNPDTPTVTYGGMQQFTAQGTFASAMVRNLANAGGMSYQLHDLSMTRAGAAAAEAGGKLYAIGGIVNGGTTPSNAVEVYDPMNDAAGWAAAGNLGSPRTGARAASVAGKVYVFGGCSDAICNSVLGTSEVYNPASNTWSAISSTGFTARSNAAAIPLNGKIYVAGGSDGSGMPLKTVEIYDPGTDSWTTGVSLNRAAGPASGGVINGTLYVVSIASGDAVVQSFNGTMWTTVNDSAQAVGDAAAAVLNNTIYVLDGANVHAYDVTHNVWTDKASLNTARLQPEPVGIGNLIYVAGNGASGQQSAALEAFAGDEASWTSSDTTITTIDQSGKASALKVGSSTITATSLIVPSVSGNTLMTVGPVTVTPVVAAKDKNYDGTRNATIDSETLTGVLGGDETFVSLTGGTATFDTKDAGTGKTVTVTGLTLSGSKATDYVLSSTTATATASIKAVYVQVTASSTTVTYGDAVPTITPSYSGFISGEDQNNADGFTAPTCVTNYTTTSNAGGSYYTRCSAAAATNYKFTYVDGSVTVNKATATINVTPYNVTYDGGPHTAMGTATGVGGADLSASLNLTGTTHKDAGTYAADPWTFTGGTNYNDASGTVKDCIKKANAVVVVTPYSMTYDGHPHTAVVASITGVNGETGATVGTVDVSHTTHTDAGTYSSDYWTFTGAANYNNIGNMTITDVISKATAAVSVTPYTVTYDGHPHTAVVASITGVNGETGATVGTVDVSHTTHTDAGTYSSDYWTFTGAANYNDIASTTIQDVIYQATATIVVNGFSGQYDAIAHGATGTAKGVQNEDLGALLSLGAAFTDVPGGTAHWTFAGNTDYKAAAGDATITITQAPSSVAVICPAGVTYNGMAQSPCSATVTGVNLSQILTVGYVSNVNVGTATASASYPGDTDHTGSGGMANFMISPAPTSTSVSSSLDPSNWGDVVTLTATVSNTNNQALPTGNISFYNAVNGATCAALGSSMLLDTEPLTTVGSSQQAATSTPNLPVGPGNTVGTDNILACFNNNMADPSFNSNFMPSNGAVTQTVNPAPIVTLVPTNLSFGNQQGGTSSNAQAVTVCNGPSGVSGSTCSSAPVSTAALSIASIGFTNSNTSPVYFTQSSVCPIAPSLLSVGSSCTINVKFAPPANASGLASAQVTLTDNNRNVTGSLQSASLTGSGTSSISGVGSLSTYALFATAGGCSSVNISGNGTVDSYNGLSNSGNVGSNGNATLSGNPMVNGAIYSPLAGSGNCSSKTMTGLSTSGKAQATGGLKALPGPVNYPLPPAPSPAPPTTTQNISGSCGTVSGCSSAGGSKSVNLAPGSYGNLSATGGTTLNLSAGRYNFNSLTLAGNSILYVDSGPIVINLAGASLSASGAALDLSGGSIVNPSGVTSNLQFYYAGSKAFKVSGGTGSYALVYAPNAAINISGGAHFYGSIVGSTINSSGNTAVHYDAAETAINMGQTIWFNSSGLNVQGLPNTGSVKLYITNAMITFTANNIAYALPVPNAVVTFSSSVSSASTTWDATNNRWSTLIPMSGVKGNATIHSFFDGLAYQVPMNFPGGIQNVTWQAAYSTSTPGLNFNWQWGAAVYGAFGPYSTEQINPLDNADPAGTPESQKGNLVFGDMGTGYTGLYAGTTAVVPTIAPLSFSQNSLDFGTVPQGGPSAQISVTLTNNDSVPYTINAVNGIQIIGAYASDFTVPNNCPISPSSLAANGGSCTFIVTLTPSAPSGTKETAKIVVNDNANNSPQTVFLKGIVQ